MAEYRSGGVPVSCPDCGAPVNPQRDQLCAQCGYPLMFLRERPGAGAEPGFGVARAPGEHDEPAPAAHPVLLQPVPPTQPPAPGEIGCPACYEVNPDTRIRCQRCGHELRPARPVPLVLPPMPKAKRSRARIAVLAAVVVVLALGAALTIWVLNRQGPARFAQQPSPSPAVLVPVPATAVSVTATAEDEEIDKYGVAKTIDGKLDTAWHSGGRTARPRPISTNVGVEVRFVFTGPVKLAEVTVVNGFARSPTDFTNNHRVKKMTVRTDTAEKEWSMADTADPQTLTFDGAPTARVTFIMVETYPGTKFEDVCISEVTFEEYA
jgi:ribosomal protein L37E